MTRLEKLLKRIGITPRSSQQSKVICLDIGSHTTKICVDGKILPSQPTCFLQDRTTGSVLVAGEQAGRMLGKLPENILPVFPVRAGKVTDTEAYAQFLKVLLDPFSSGGVLHFLQPPHVKAAELFPDHLTQKKVGSVNSVAVLL
jgi:actin-like ATPase involved in cell morphogenesis